LQQEYSQIWFIEKIRIRNEIKIFIEAMILWKKSCFHFSIPTLSAYWHFMEFGNLTNDLFFSGKVIHNIQTQFGKLKKCQKNKLPNTIIS